MRVKDLGNLDGPIVLFGGVYSNFPALKAFADLVEERHVVSAGDILGFGSKPDEAIALARNARWPMVVGLAECQMGGMGDPSCASPLVLHTATANTISESDRNWMASLPDVLTFIQGERRYAVLGGCASESPRVLWPSSAEAEFRDELTAFEDKVGPVDGLIVGRSGIAFQRVVEGRQWIDVGTLGLPPHDGRPQTRYAVLDDGEVTFERLSYDYQTSVRDMEEIWLSPSYQKALEAGIWPDEAALPPELMRSSYSRSRAIG